mgnify:CR=1 FL=1
MSKAAGISGSIQPTGFNKSRKGSYYIPQNTVKRSETLKLRAGEVVQGTILDTYANNEASVRLPVGSFRCELHGNLKRGDELYFKVIEAHPVLYLKVYSVSVAYQNKIRKSSEIIRILDLPDNNIYNSLIDFLISQKHIIIRDEALLIMRDYNELSESDLNNKSNTEIT